jgi:hypothetical protein
MKIFPSPVADIEQNIISFEKVTDDDVLKGRNPGMSKRPGNVKLLQLAQTYASEYSAAARNKEK